MKTNHNKIEDLQYRTIEQGFYEVYATDGWNIIIEGNVSKEILTYLIETAKKDKASVVKIRTKDEYDFISNTQKIKKENSELKKVLKRYKEKLRKIKRITQ